ncbi:MAG: hypothetical protein JWN04_3434 [Myxococcaceae bacterium]|nr:hypothetical protein [Myxococcaceae bacterium]
MSADAGRPRLLSEAVLVDLHARLSAIPCPPGVERPGLGELEAALEACFWASLQTDETRPTVGTLVFASPESCTQYIRLAQPEELVDLRKTLPATQAATSALALQQGRIWGVALTLPTNAVLLSILGPGRVLFRAGNQSIACFADGLVHLVSNPQIPTDRIAAGDVARSKPVELLQELSIPMRRLGHGGAVITTSHGLDGLVAGHELHAEQRIRNWSTETKLETDAGVALDDETLQSQADQARAHRLLMERGVRESIAQLSAVDGVVVLDQADPPSVLAFGAKIIGGGRENSVLRIELFEFPDYRPKYVRLDKLGGTRHQSAARYAANHEGVLVLVVSQDGRSSIMHSSADELGTMTVRVYRGFEQAIPLDADTLRFGHYVHATPRMSAQFTISALSDSSFENL